MPSGSSPPTRKTRVPIEPHVAADVLFASDRTCCICRVRGRPVQIHHIDDDPSNNDWLNLVVLCLDCHNETQLKGGFGRRLDAAQVRQYRGDWFRRIQSRRDRADALAAEVMGNQAFTAGATRPATRPQMPLAAFVRTLPELRRRAHDAARPGFESGITAEMVNAGYSVVDVLEDAIVSLATYYPEGHFDRENPRDYFSDLIASRFRWHRYHIETEGQGRGGTIVGTMVVGSVIADLEQMIDDIVTSFSLSMILDWGSTPNDALEQWRREWHLDLPATSR